MKKKAAKPIKASPTIGPTTAPAIHALLPDFSSGGGIGVGVGVGVVVGVETAGVDRGLEVGDLGV